MDAANDNIVQAKICTRCGELKELSDFPKHRRHKDGHGSQCKLCKRKVDAAYRLRNPNKNKEDYRRRIAKNPNYWAERYANNLDEESKRVSDWQKRTQKPGWRLIDDSGRKTRTTIEITSAKIRKGPPRSESVHTRRK